VVADEVMPLTDKHFERLLAATKNVPVIEEPMFMKTLNDVIAQYDDLLVRMQRSGHTYAGLTREESLLHDAIEDFQAGNLDLMRKYPLVADRKIHMAQLDTKIGVIQDRREKLMKLMKAKEAQVALLFPSDNYYIRSEWSAKTIMSNPLKPMSTLDISLNR
jgi:hypothetical protein